MDEELSRMILNQFSYTVAQKSWDSDVVFTMAAFGKSVSRTFKSNPRQNLVIAQEILREEMAKELFNILYRSHC
jgi:hypothetical protein